VKKIYAKRAITPFIGIQGHRGRYQSKARMRIPVSDSNWRCCRSLLFKFWTLRFWAPSPLFGWALRVNVGPTMFILGSISPN